MRSTAIPRRAAIGLAAASACAAALGSAAWARGDEALVVFAAASLGGAMGEIARGWEAATGRPVTASYAGSSALARQIEQGAPADVFVSANEAWMDALEADGLIRTGTRRDLLSNRLVLIAHGPAEPVAIGPGLDLAGMLGEGRLAMALLDAVPAGLYGREALTSLGLWDAVAPRVVQADNARAALALVALGEAPLGVVYATDALAEPRVSVLGPFPEGSHAPIAYPAAVTAGSAHPQARAFLDHLGSPEARAVFERHGFAVLAG